MVKTVVPWCVKHQGALRSYCINQTLTSVYQTSDVSQTYLLMHLLGARFLCEVGVRMHIALKLVFLNEYINQ